MLWSSIAARPKRSVGLLLEAGSEGDRVVSSKSCNLEQRWEAEQVGGSREGKERRERSGL